MLKVKQDSVPFFPTASTTSNRNFLTTTQRNGTETRTKQRSTRNTASIDINIFQEPLNALQYLKNTHPKEEQKKITNCSNLHLLSLFNQDFIDDQIQRKKKNIQVTVDIQPIIYRKSYNQSTRTHHQKQFTLQQVRPQSYDNQGRVSDKIDQNKIDLESVPQQSQNRFTTELGLPRFDKYKAKDPIRRYDMIFNVKQLIRLQDKREKLYMNKQASDPEFQLEIIKRKNQIQMLLQNTRKLEDLKAASGGIITHIQNQDKLQDELCEDFGKQIQVL